MVMVSAGRIDEYLELVRTFPLEHIQDDAHLDAALSVIDHLIDKPERSEAEEAYLLALTDLVETYEDLHVIIPEVSGVAMVRNLMEENGLTQADLAPLFGSASIVSEVLSGKRRLALSHIERLSEYFGLPADVFIDRAGDVGRGRSRRRLNE